MKTKSFLSIAFLAMALMASCQKNDETSKEPDPEPQPEVKEVTAEFLIPSTLSQREFFEQEFEFKVNDSTVSVKESEMTEVSDIKACEVFKLDVEKAIRFMSYKTDSVKFYKGTIGKVKKGDKIVGVKMSATLKSDRPAVDSYDYFYGFALIVDGKEVIDISSEAALHKGLYSDEESIKAFWKLTYKKFPFDYTY